MIYNFEWDTAKAESNVRKHGVTFEQAAQVFLDPMALSIFDDETSSPGEERWVTLGRVKDNYYLVAVHTVQEGPGESVRIRLISARRATRNEIRQYEQG